MMMKPTFFLFIFLFIILKSVISVVTVCPENNITIANLDNLVPLIVPTLEGKTKGDAGKICVIGGSFEFAGGPYMASISALKVGGDMVSVITTEAAAPIIKSYSTVGAVYPYLNYKSMSKIRSILQKIDVIIIGPGLAKNDELTKIISATIEMCKALQKPLVIDAKGLDAISRNPSVIKDYPSPGVILTPNQGEAKTLRASVSNNSSGNWYNYWGNFVSVLIKGKQDTFYSANSSYDWSSSQGGSGRRTIGQGDILAGFLGTLYNWALKQLNCDKENHVQLSQSVSAFAAAKLTRLCNSKGFLIYGRSMLTSDMIGQIHNAYKDVFGQL